MLPLNYEILPLMNMSDRFSRLSKLGLLKYFPVFELAKLLVLLHAFINPHL